MSQGAKEHNGESSGARRNKECAGRHSTVYHGKKIARQKKSKARKYPELQQKGQEYDPRKSGAQPRQKWNAWQQLLGQLETSCGK
jgi:hypothetical protein